MSATDRPSEEAIDAAASQWSDWDTLPRNARHHLRRYAEVALKAAYAVDFPAGSGPQQDERFARLAELKGNWDSYGGLPIDAAAMERAKAWLRNAAVVPCSDGGVQLEWHSEGCDVEIVFRADGTTEAFAEEIGSRGPTPEGERRTEGLLEVVQGFRNAIALALVELHAADADGAISDKHIARAESLLRGALGSTT